MGCEQVRDAHLINNNVSHMASNIVRKAAIKALAIAIVIDFDLTPTIQTSENLKNSLETTLNYLVKRTCSSMIQHGLKEVAHLSAANSASADSAMRIS